MDKNTADMLDAVDPTRDRTALIHMTPFEGIKRPQDDAAIVLPGFPRVLMKLLIVSTLIIITLPAYAGNCSTVIEGALRLVLVTTSSMDSATARVRLFSRATSEMAWTLVGRAEPAVVGRAGLAWGYTFVGFRRDGELEKIEGDRRTPSGFFRIGRSFGFKESNLPGYLLIKPGETVCVEDPASHYYNSIRRRSEVGAAVKPDDMGRTPLYRSGLFVEYPSDRIGRRGSCIFIHIWEGPDKGTNGCIGLPDPRVKMLQKFSQENAVIAILSETALDRFANCLPAP